MNSKLLRIFIKPVTTDKRNYRFSRNFFAEKIFPAQSSGRSRYNYNLVGAMGTWEELDGGARSKAIILFSPEAGAGCHSRFTA